MSDEFHERDSAPGDAGGQDAEAAREERRTARSRWPVRAFRMEDEPGPDLRSTTTPEERLAMMWPLAREAWTLAGRAIPDYPRHGMPVRIIHPDSEAPVD